MPHPPHPPHHHHHHHHPPHPHRPHHGPDARRQTHHRTPHGLLMHCRHLPRHRRHHHHRDQPHPHRITSATPTPLPRNTKLPPPQPPPARNNLRESHQPPGRRWFCQLCLLSAKTSSFPCSGEGVTPPPTPSPGPGRGGPRAVRAPKMAQDGSKRASESPRWPPRSLKIAQHGSR